MADYELLKIDGTQATLDELKQFSAVPFSIPWYRSQESNKVFPLFLNEVTDLNASSRPLARLIGTNPFFNHTSITYLLAKQAGKPVGRIAAFVDERYNQENNESAGWIGMFECIEDKSLAVELVDQAAAILDQKGCKRMIGPAKFNANGEIGLLIDGFDKKPFFMEGYNTPYYPDFFSEMGFRKENDWYSIQVDSIKETRLNEYMSKVERLKERVDASTDERSRLMREVKIRPVSFANFGKEVEILEELYNGEWGKGKHPQFVTMTHDEMGVLASGIKLIALEELVLIAELDGKPIGISATVPNINEVIFSYDRARSKYMPSNSFLSPRDLSRDISILAQTKKKLSKKSFESLRVLILGVKEEYRKSGIDALLYYETFKTATGMGVKSASFSELADINLEILRPLEKMGDRAMTWRVYSLDL